MRTVFFVALLMAGCASAPEPAGPQAVAAAPSCSELSADIERAEQAQRTAHQKKGDAWKAVIPFAVAGRYVSAKNAIDDADQQVERLEREAALRGCIG